MAFLKAFRAWRPKPKHVTEITCLPYDVVDTRKARKILSNQEHAEYEELEVTEIKWEDRNFVVVQNRVMGVCGSIVASQVVVYEDVKGVLKVNSHFLTEDYVNGLVDTDQDGHMEVVLVSLASTGIYELKSNKLREKVHLSWSFDGCPC